MIDENEFLEQLTQAVGQEDYDRSSIKSRFSDYKKYMRQRFSFACPIIIIGGTNGKGAVAKNLAALAKHNQIKAAMWTSPHIESLVERYEYDGEPIQLDYLIEKIQYELDHSKIKLSLFEILFTTFCQWASEQQPELLILEVGLGGRLDATNVFDADVSIITSISRDHIQFLGGSYLGILNEKFEIARENSFFIGQSQLAYIRNKMQEKAQKLGCEYQILAQEKDEGFSHVNKRISELAFQKLYPDKNVDISFQERVPSYSHHIEFNGAHNLDGMRQLMNSLCQKKNYEKTNLVLAFSKRSSSEVKILLKTVLGYRHLFAQIVMTAFEHSRSLDADVSRQLAEECDIFFEKDWKKNINESIRQETPVLVAGSYYFVGEVKRHLSNIPQDNARPKTPV